jgi:hypothetical protein
LLEGVARVQKGIPACETDFPEIRAHPLPVILGQGGKQAILRLISSHQRGRLLTSGPGQMLVQYEPGAMVCVVGDAG